MLHSRLSAALCQRMQQRQGLILAFHAKNVFWKHIVRVRYYNTSKGQKRAMTSRQDSANDILLHADRDGIHTLTLNRPESRNSLSIELMEALTTALDDLRDNPECKAIVIAAAGSAFCAGHDLKDMRANNDPDFYARTFNVCFKLMQTIVQHSRPIIARVQGVATAAGCQLVASCDLAIASDTANFATPGVNIGLFCSTPMVALSRNVSRKQAMEMLLTGDMIDATTAETYGLINRSVPEAELDAAIKTLTDKIATKSAYTMRIGKEAFYRQLEMSLSEAYTYATKVMTENMLADDAQEGVAAFLEKREPVWTQS